MEMTAKHSATTFTRTVYRYARAMKRSYVAMVFVLGCISGGVAGRVAEPAAHAQTPAGVTRWEYDCGKNPSMKQINDAGAQGWEMVAISPVNGGGSMAYTNELTICFKRAMP